MTKQRVESCTGQLRQLAAEVAGNEAYVFIGQAVHLRGTNTHQNRSARRQLD